MNTLLPVVAKWIIIDITDHICNTHTHTYIYIYIMQHVYLLSFSTVINLFISVTNSSLQWRNNWRESVPNHQPHDRLLNCSFRRRSKKTSKPRVTGICEGNSPVTSEFHSQRASYAVNVSISWRHHVKCRWCGPRARIGTTSPDRKSLPGSVLNDVYIAIQHMPEVYTGGIIWFGQTYMYMYM